MDFPYLTVTQITQAIQCQLESQFSHVQVQGEVSNFKRQSSGHLYFSLKDEGAQINCVLFRGQAMHLAKDPKEGDHLRVKGEISVYAPRGSYQLIVREVLYDGIGALLLQFEALKQKLKEKGWFEAARKKKIPPFPKKIGIVTSPTGAVIRDMLHILNRRQNGYHVILNPVKVQGEGAALEIAQAIEDFNRWNLVDVIILARGGGSIEDLWAFNEEKVAESIFKSKIPIISAIGHETDTTIADFVADQRAPTPSSAAELVMKAKEEPLEFLFQMDRHITQALKHLLKQNQERLKRIQLHPLIATPEMLTRRWNLALDEKELRLESKMELHIKKASLQLKSFMTQHRLLNPLEKIKKEKIELENFSKNLDLRWVQIEQRAQEKLSKIKAHLDSINPKNLLQKGYSILFDEKGGSAIVSAKELRVDQKVKFLLGDGAALATVDQIFEERRL